MKSLLHKTLAVLAFAALWSGCQSTQANLSPTTMTFQIIDHQASQSQKDPPSWVTADNSEIEAMTAYQEKYAFKFDGGDAQTLEQAIAATRSIDPSTPVLRSIKERLTKKFLDLKMNDKDRVKDYFAAVVDRVVSSKFENLKLEKEFWTQVQYFKAYATPDPDRIYFRFVVLYSLTRKDVVDRILTAFDEQAAVEQSNSSDDVKARGALKQYFVAGY